MAVDLFNSSFEMELRVATLLCTDYTRALSSERILALDFMTCYGKTFGFGDTNLHGDNTFMYGEISSRRALIHEAIKYLVCRGAVDVEINRGYLYRITDIGKEYVLALESEYAKEYESVAEKVSRELSNYSDDMLMRMIQHKAGTEGVCE